MNPSARPASEKRALVAMALIVMSLGAGVAAPTSADSLAPPHLELLRSEPMADSTIVESPTEIRLFFSEPPVMSGTTVRLADPAEELVPTGEATADESDPRQVYIELAEEGIMPGDYTVHWRVIAQDGHSQRGDFSFRLQPE